MAGSGSNDSEGDSGSEQKADSYRPMSSAGNTKALKKMSFSLLSCSRTITIIVESLFGHVRPAVVSESETRRRKQVQLGGW